RSRKRIRDLDYFSKVDIENIPGSADDKAVVKIDVEEKSTGSLSVGVGFATDSGPMVDLGIRERNLLGRGQRISLKSSLAAQKSTFNLGFTEPYFLDREISAGLDVFHTTTDLQDTQSLDSGRTGGGIRIGYPLSEDLRQSIQYAFAYDEIKNISSSASELIKSQERERYVSKVSHVLVYDLRNSRLKPTDGFYTRMRNEVAGLGGNVHYLKNVVRVAQYNTLMDEWILSASGRAGYVYGLGEDVQISDRFFLGGQGLRGFATSGIGPRDTLTKDALGGEWMYNGSLELQMPLGLPNEFGVTGRVFTDMGSAGSIHPSNSNVADSGNIRVSAGAGFGWISPFGPVNVDFGFPLVKDSHDITETIRLNFGTRF
ncbi:MAG: outer membrane protein assembly factor BamA, partial [Pseudomonadota bacterium]|nr:outer membrane protein assembly factor BamA [Pseudomonadota bacterium]